MEEIWSPFKQIFAYVRGIHFIRPLMGVGSGLADLVLLPIEQYQRDGQLLRGLRRGGVSFFYTLADQTLDTGARLTAKTQNILIYAEQLLTGDSNNGQELAAQQPVGTTAGVREGVSHLSRQLSSTAATIAAVPMQGYNEGVSSAVSSLLTAVPTAILRPAHAVAGAATMIMQGALAALHPERELEHKAKYKQATPKDMATKLGFTKGERVRWTDNTFQCGFIIGYLKSMRDDSPVVRVQMVDQITGEEIDNSVREESIANLELY
jgi:autophagy-related protein 2